MQLIPEHVFKKLAIAQYRTPWTFIIISVIVTIIAGIVASDLEFDSSYEALLPENSPEIKNADDIRAKTGGTRQLIIALSGSSQKQRLDFARKLIPSLQQIDGIRSVDLEFPVDYFEDRAFWLADLTTLDKLIPALEDAVRLAKIQANPFALSLDEESDQKELDDAWTNVERIAQNARGDTPFNALLESEDGTYTFMAIVPSIKFSDMEKATTLLSEIKDVVQSNNPKKHEIKIRYAGSLEVLNEQHEIMKRDMIRASLLAIALGVILVAGFTRRLLAPFIVAVALMSGIIWTFAFARIHVGHVNIITGFLVAVLIGLGIDFGIHLFVRFSQERQNETTDLKTAMIAFVCGTAPPAMTAALTTAGVFFTFSAAEFRGFSEFGQIAGVGVILTFVSSFLILPPLVRLAYSHKHFKATAGGTPPWLQKNMPLSLAVTVCVVALLLAGMGVWGAKEIPFRNDFRELRGHSPASEFTSYVDSQLGAGFNPVVFLADSLSDAEKIKKTLSVAIESDKRRINNHTAIDKVISVTDFLPDISDERWERINKLRDILNDKALNTEAKKDTPSGEYLQKGRQMVRTEPWDVDDIPDAFRRRFVTMNTSSPQYLVIAWPREHHEADYLAAEWEIRLNEISNQLNRQGISHQMVDETLIVSWVYRLVRQDSGPLLIMASLVVLVLLLADFRSIRTVTLLLTPLIAGIFGFIGVAWLLGLEFNMFNMIVIPSIIGIGIDNTVHIFHRYTKAGRGSVLMVIRKTGSAAFLASTTTAIGFGSSIISHNVGLKSMGYMAVIGIGFTFIASVIILPSLLRIRERLVEHNSR